MALNLMRYWRVAEVYDVRAALELSDSPDLSDLLHVAEFRHAPAEVAPLHGIRAEAQCSLVGG